MSEMLNQWEHRHQFHLNLILANEGLFFLRLQSFIAEGYLVHVVSSFPLFRKEVLTTGVNRHNLSQKIYWGTA